MLNELSSPKADLELPWRSSKPSVIGLGHIEDFLTGLSNLREPLGSPRVPLGKPLGVLLWLLGCLSGRLRRLSGLRSGLSGALGASWSSKLVKKWKNGPLLTRELGFVSCHRASRVKKWLLLEQEQDCKGFQGAFALFDQAAGVANYKELRATQKRAHKRVRVLAYRCIT